LMFLGWIILGIGIYFSYGFKKNFDENIEAKKLKSAKNDAKNSAKELVK